MNKTKNSQKMSVSFNELQRFVSDLSTRFETCAKERVLAEEFRIQYKNIDSVSVGEPWSCNGMIHVGWSRQEVWCAIANAEYPKAAFAVEKDYIKYQF